MSPPLSIRALQGDLEYVKRQLAEHTDPYDTVRLMWEQRKDQLEKEIVDAEDHPDNFAQVALLFRGQPVVGSEEIRLDFAAKVLENYQTLVATLTASRAGNEVGARGRLPSAFTSKLFIRDIVRGSVGFLIEEKKPDQYALVPSLLKETVEEATEIISKLSSGDSGNADLVMHALSPRTLNAIKRLAKVLHDSGAETEIVAQSRELVLDHSRTNSLYLQLLDVEFTERRERRSGILLGLFPERQQYEFNPGGGTPIFYGPVSEAFDIRYRSDPEFARSILFKPAVATFMVNSTLRGGAPQKEEWVLEDIEMSSPQILGSPSSSDNGT